MRREGSSWSGVAIVVVSVVLALLVGGVALGLSGTRVETHTNTRDVVPPENGEPVVATLRESGGFAPFGQRIVDSTHYVEVRFLDGPDCARSMQPGDPWPTSHAECSSPTHVAGTVRGLGVTASGRSIVGVEFTVSGACFEQLSVGSGWPPIAAECAAR